MSAISYLITVCFITIGISCNSSPYIFSNHNTAFYQCLKGTGYDWVTIYIKSDSNAMSQPFIQDVYNANNAGLKVELFIVGCRGIAP